MHVLVKHVPLDFSSLGLRVMARTRRLREQLDALAAAVAKADERAAKADERAARLETEVVLLKTSIVNPRLQAFTSDPGDASRRLKTSQKQTIHDIYGNRCAFCGRQEQGRIRLTVALVANKDHQKLFDWPVSWQRKIQRIVQRALKGGTPFSSAKVLQMLAMSSLMRSILPSSLQHYSSPVGW